MVNCALLAVADLEHALNRCQGLSYLSKLDRGRGKGTFTGHVPPIRDSCASRLCSGVWLGDHKAQVGDSILVLGILRRSSRMCRTDYFEVFSPRMSTADATTRISGSNSRRTRVTGEFRRLPR